MTDRPTPLRRVRLTLPQRRLLERACERKGPMRINGNEMRSADTLTDEGLATQGNRGGWPTVQATARGRAWLARWAPR